MRKIYTLLLLLSLVACNSNSKITADLIVTNAVVYTVNDNFDTAEAFAVKNGKFVAIGTTKEILEAYEPKGLIDAGGKVITPGFIDAHCHFLGLGYNQQAVNLMGTKSFEEVVQRVVAFQKKHNLKYIQGRGWDQNDWEEKKFPNKKKLDELFPNTPISLTRVDGPCDFV